MLLTAYLHGGTPDYDTWHQDHSGAEQALKTAGLLHSDNGPHHASVHPDVRYRLDRRRST